MKKHQSISEVWDHKWENFNIERHAKESLKFDTWTRNHKPIIDKYLKRLNKGGIFLEAGCGIGQWCFYASRKYNIKSIGVDIAEKTINRLNLFLKSHKNNLISFIIDDLNNSVLSDNYCDMFVCLGVIEHFKDSEPMMRTLHRLLKPEGVGIITVPNVYSTHTFARPILKILNKWDIGYEKSLSPNSLKKLSIKSGFKVVECGVLPYGEIFGFFLNSLPIIGNLFKELSYFIEKRQNILGFVSFVVVKK